MTQDLEDEARSMIKNPRWRWLEGMYAVGKSGRTVFGRVRIGRDVLPGCIPDLGDAETRRLAEWILSDGAHSRSASFQA